MFLIAISVLLENLTFLNCALTLTVGWIIYRWIKCRLLNFPPGPLGFPIVGSIPYFESHAEKTFASWTKIYGSVMMVDIGTTRNVVLNSFESIEEAFIRQSSAFFGRYNTYFTKFTTENKGLIFLANVDSWKAQRQFGSRALFGSGIHGISIEERILNEAEQLCEVIRQKHGKPFVLESELMLYVANVIGDILVAERCSDNEDLKQFIEHLVEGFRGDAVAYTLLTIFPWSRYFPFLNKSMQNMKRGITLGNNLMDTFIDQHLKRLDPKEARDMTDLYLIEYNQKSFSFETLKQLRFYLKDLFAAGTETTTSSIRWILFYLIKHPEIQEKVHNEIDDVLGSGGKVRLNSDLPYTRAVIQEGFRIQPVTPLSVPRKTVRDVTLMGYHIPKDTQIFANIYAVHHDPNHFPEPEKFIPERHLDENGNFLKSNRIIPFSIGSRNCLGENLARSEVFLFLVTILQKFEVKPNSENPNPPNEGVAGVVNSPAHYLLVMKEK